jgi:hypothetical protein
MCQRQSITGRRAGAMQPLSQLEMMQVEEQALPLVHLDQLYYRRLCPFLAALAPEISEIHFDD